MSASLEKIRADIDALDADLRALLLARAQLVAQVAEAKKATNGASGSPLRPMREMQQMLSLLNWQKNDAPALSAAGVIAIWREIIGMALAQQGGVTIYASSAAMPLARTHFGASLDYQLSDMALRDAAANARGLAVLTLAEATAPEGAQSVLARLPLLGDAAALVYGQTDEDAPDDNCEKNMALVARNEGEAGERVIYQAADFALVETKTPKDAPIWGRYLTLDDAR